MKALDIELFRTDEADPRPAFAVSNAGKNGVNKRKFYDAYFRVFYRIKK